MYGKAIIRAIKTLLFKRRQRVNGEKEEDEEKEEQEGVHTTSKGVDNIGLF